MTGAGAQTGGAQTGGAQKHGAQKYGVAVVLVVAKAPVPGQAKTRLIGGYGETGAAELAAASLLDTLRAARSVPAARVVIACRGDLADGVRAGDVVDAAAGCRVIPQRGNDFGERLAAAHRDAAADADVVFQIGMDTPQITATDIVDGLTALDGPGTDAVLGPAGDGGWWSLGLRSARGAEVLPGVPMSRSDTGAQTEQALADHGMTVRRLRVLDDVDHPHDVARVAARCGPGSEFAGLVRRLEPVRRSS